jgi:hypothetical protein
VYVPNEGSQCDPTGSSNIHKELEKVNIPEFMGAMDGSVTESWLENMVMCFTLCDYTSKMKFHMVVFQLKGWIGWNRMMQYLTIRQNS